MVKTKQPFVTKEIEVEIDKLHLDLTNVRFQHISGRKSEKDMEELILKEGDTKELYDQIKSNGGLYEQPVIDTKFTVLEGNRRLVCLRRLKKEANEGKLSGLDKTAFNVIKCRIVPENIAPEDIKLFLAAIHVKGKKDWPTFNRAKQIHDLNRIFNKSFDVLSKHLGMGKVTLIRMVDVYQQTKKYGDRYPQDVEWFRKYTYFDELYKKKDLKKFRELQKNVDLFADWIYEKKFDEVRDVRGLAEVLADEDARHQLERGRFKDALAIVQTKNPTIKSREFKKISQVIEIIRTFPRKEFMKTAQDPARRKILEQLKQEVISLLKDLEKQK